MPQRVIPVVLTKHERSYPESHKSVQEIAQEIEEVLHRENLRATFLHNLSATSNDPQNRYNNPVPCMLVFAESAERPEDTFLGPIAESAD